MGGRAWRGRCADLAARRHSTPAQDTAMPEAVVPKTATEAVHPALVRYKNRARRPRRSESKVPHSKVESPHGQSAGPDGTAPKAREAAARPTPVALPSEAAQSSAAVAHTAASPKMNCRCPRDRFPLAGAEVRSPASVSENANRCAVDDCRLAPGAWHAEATKAAQAAAHDHRPTPRHVRPAATWFRAL